MEETKIIQYLGYIKEKRNTYVVFECPSCKNHITTRKSIIKKNKFLMCQRCSHNKLKQENPLSRTKLYNVWASFKDRCFNEKSKPYKNYGGRGISVYKKWVNDFKAFYDWSIENGYKEGLSIDRINNDGNYEPSNCRWADWNTQAINKQRISIRNTSGYVGVSYYSKRRTFVASVTINGTTKKIFENKDAYIVAKYREEYIISNNIIARMNFD